MVVRRSRLMRSSPAGSRAVRLLTVVATIGATLVSIGVARADYAYHGGELPYGANRTSAVFDGIYAYVFGGTQRQGIVKIDTRDRAVELARVELPAPRALTSAVWAGRYAYIFGGDDGPLQRGNTSDDIVRYDPASDTVRTMEAKLPEALAATSAVWTGEYVYLFGGYNYRNQARGKIYRYDPATDTIAEMGATLSQARWGSSAAWDGRYAYVFGGRGWTAMYDQIDRYDPEEDTVTRSTTKMPYYLTSAVWDGHNVLLFGGGYHDNYDPFYTYVVPYVYKYDPAGDRLEYMSGYLPSARAGTSAIWTGAEVMVFGGYHMQKEGCGSYCYIRYDVSKKDFVRYTPLPSAPSGVRAIPATYPGSTKLIWTAPYSYTYSAPLTSFRIYRSFAVSGGGYYASPEPYAEIPAYFGEFVDEHCKLTYICYYRVSAVNAHGEGPLSAEVFLPGTATEY